jgi:hypothetical protein
MKRDLYSDVTARILQNMEAGIMPWERQWQSAGSAIPMNATTDRPYSGVNVLLFWMSADQGYSRPRYLTFNQILMAQKCPAVALISEGCYGSKPRRRSSQPSRRRRVTMGCLAMRLIS